MQRQVLSFAVHKRCINFFNDTYNHVGEFYSQRWRSTNYHRCVNIADAPPFLFLFAPFCFLLLIDVIGKKGKLRRHLRHILSIRHSDPWYFRDINRIINQIINQIINSKKMVLLDIQIKNYKRKVILNFEFEIIINKKRLSIRIIKIFL